MDGCPRLLLFAGDTNYPMQPQRLSEQYGVVTWHLQTWPQEPQWFGSLERSRQRPPQSVFLPGHVGLGTHWRSRQVPLAAQGVLQGPQWLGPGL